MSETQTENANVTVEQEARIIVGLQAGRIVNYVMLNGAIRPMIVTNPFAGDGVVNGILFFDGSNDLGYFPNPRRVGDSGHASETAEWIEGAEFREPFDDNGELKAGTWHWPVQQRVRASSVDANALETVGEQIGAMLRKELLAKLRDELLGNQEQMIATVNTKLQTTLQAVNDSLDSHSQMVQRVANLSGIVIGKEVEQESFEGGEPGEKQPAASGDGLSTGADTGTAGRLPTAQDLDAHVADQPTETQGTTTQGAVGP